MMNGTFFWFLPAKYMVGFSAYGVRLIVFIKEKLLQFVFL
jgi:hypothetical protein